VGAPEEYVKGKKKNNLQLAGEKSAWQDLGGGINGEWIHAGKNRVGHNFK